MTVGTIMPYAGSIEPPGYLICDGRSISTSEFPDLFSVIGFNFGGSGGSFNLPDLRARTPLGVNNLSLPNGFDPGPGDYTGLSTRDFGDTNREQNHVLTIPEMPSHIHSGTTDGPNPNDHTHTYSVFAPSGQGPIAYQAGSFTTTTTTTGTAGDHSHSSLTVNNTGNDEGHNNLQPYVVMHWVIRYK